MSSSRKLRRSPMSGCVWMLGDLPEGATTWPLCLAPTVEGDPFCPWHRQCAALDQFGDAHRGPNPPESQAPEPTALDAGGSEGMETAPPAVTIPEDQRWAECHRRNDFSGERVVSTPTTLHRAATWSADYHPTHKSVVVRLVTADEWDAICARLAKLDRIEATRRAVKAGPAIPSPSDWEAFIDALDGEP